ncbi:hypothetical protein CEXT_498611 [Caerostris extrusa]|uniref:Uncharacterized protein n=1 Tax=Caerostris extrusa TaxID=172846 RepID=A0AAV4TK96_CAEEX|nr:hypothetical protein CEXT_498611 [Caerostris extrusa]
MMALHYVLQVITANVYPRSGFSRIFREKKKEKEAHPPFSQRPQEQECVNVVSLMIMTVGGQLGGELFAENKTSLMTGRPKFPSFQNLAASNGFGETSVSTGRS